MIVHDFHNCSLEQAEKILDCLIYKAHLEQTSQMLFLITGNGQIKNLFLETLLPQYKLSAQEQIGNPGVLIVYT